MIILISISSRLKCIFVINDRCPVGMDSSWENLSSTQSPWLCLCPSKAGLLTRRIKMEPACAVHLFQASLSVYQYPMLHTHTHIQSPATIPGFTPFPLQPSAGKFACISCFASWYFKKIPTCLGSFKSTEKWQTCLLASLFVNTKRLLCLTQPWITQNLRARQAAHWPDLCHFSKSAANTLWRSENKKHWSGKLIGSVFASSHSSLHPQAFCGLFHG